MRCWNCHVIIAMPDIINGEVGRPGMIRRGEAEPLPPQGVLTPPQEVVTNFGCHRCGAMYRQTTGLVGFKIPAGATGAGAGADDQGKDVGTGELWTKSER